MLREHLEQQVKAFQSIGCPALLEMFIVKHGEEFQGVRRPRGVRRQQMKQCFKELHELD